MLKGPCFAGVLFMLRKLVQCTIRERGRKEFSVAISNLSLLSDLMLKATFLNLAEENRKCCVSTSHIECKLLVMQQNFFSTIISLYCITWICIPAKEWLSLCMKFCSVSLKWEKSRKIMWSLRAVFQSSIYW